MYRGWDQDRECYSDLNSGSGLAREACDLGLNLNLCCRWHQCLTQEGTVKVSLFIAVGLQQKGKATAHEIQRNKRAFLPAFHVQIAHALTHTCNHTHTRVNEEQKENIFVFFVFIVHWQICGVSWQIAHFYQMKRSLYSENTKENQKGVRSSNGNE